MKLWNRTFILTLWCQRVRHLLLTYIGHSAGKMQITCRDKEHQYISWWAGEPSTSWCKDTSPPYSLRRQKMHNILKVYPTQWWDEAHRTLWRQFVGPPERQFRGHFQYVVTHWLARCLQVPHRSLETTGGGKKNTIRLGKHLPSNPLQWLTDGQMSCNRSRPDLKCDLWGEEYYQPAGFGLQLWGLWNRNHMRGVFCNIKTNTQRLNRN